MARLMLNLGFDFDVEPLKALVRMAADGFDGARAPAPPERLVVMSRARLISGTLTASVAPSPELLRWLADIVEANPTYK